MRNIMLFVTTTSAYLMIWYICVPTTSGQDLAVRVAVLAGLCVPVTVGKNVFTVFGSAKSKEGSVWAFWSPYQDAKKEAFSLLGGLFQTAGEDTITVFGITLVQWASKTADTFLGITVFQRGVNCDLFGGLVGVQLASKSAETILGLTLYSKVNGLPGDSFVVASEVTAPKVTPHLDNQ